MGIKECETVTSYPFVVDDAGRSKSRRPKQKSDCVVRALALLLQKPYDTIYDELAEAGRKCSRGTAKTIWKEFLADKGAVRISFPAERGERRMNLPEFCRIHPERRYVVQMAHHLTAVIGGVVHDTFAPGDERCIYACWSIPKPSRR